MKTADLSDQNSDLQYAYDLFKPFGQHIAFGGKIRTVKCFEDNSWVRKTLETPGDGAVLVVDAGGSQRCAMLGDLLAQFGVDNNWAGVIMNGMIRDSADINQMAIGVRALGTYPLKSQKKDIGEVDVVVRFAGVEFRPGEYVYADEDGIVTSPVPLS